MAADNLKCGAVRGRLRAHYVFYNTQLTLIGFEELFMITSETVQGFAGDLVVPIVRRRRHYS